ncbi:glycine--tRNA ligase subunit beta [bacterium]|jgi:glycyl-tRNA synthetase beta chain|nr:glycine--tRNA ligase subunit beta [bacterium]MBT3850671.1 glycine--tRNA ligase subunit beta [bacterium]MBT4434786.1 glycine--tRNA ligase subunit beta [bacterium]
MKTSKKLSSFLLEIFVEEMPARLVNDIESQLKNNFSQELENNSIIYEKVSSYSTPRRLIIHIEGLEKKQKDSNEFIVGPPKKISIDEDGTLLKPGNAFLDRYSIKRKQIEIITKNNSEFIGAKVRSVGIKTKDFLSQATIRCISSIKNRKFMKWGDSSFQFIRPIRNIFALFDSEFTKIKIETIKNENKIFGHRFYSNKGRKIPTINAYFKFLRDSYVLINFEDRRRSILNQIESIEKKNSFYVQIDHNLLNQVANLTEFPNVLCGNFEKEFLKIPKEVNMSVMKNHQKYFPTFKDKHYRQLDSSFVFVGGSSFINNKTVILGNEKVIRARLNDAKFFYEEDLNSGLVKLEEKLATTTFIDGVGSYREKSSRIHSICLELIKNLSLKKSINTKDLAIACKIIKSDLSSQMVNEFPELQGIMGNYYFKKENKIIAEIIEQHYLPKSRNDLLPNNELAMIVSVADKIDTIASCFALGLIPTGSSDPYALRRNSIGIIRIIEKLGQNLDLYKVLNFSMKELGKNSKIKIMSENRQKALSFLNERIKNYFVDKGFKINIINSVMNISLESRDIISMSNIANLVKENQDNKDFVNAIEGYKRLKNIVKQNTAMDINSKLFTIKDEIKLYEQFEIIKSQFTNESIRKSPKKTLAGILNITPFLSSFFENVLVMDKNEKIKNNRINLLTNIKDLISRFANLSEI